MRTMGGSTNRGIGVVYLCQNVKERFFFSGFYALIRQWSNNLPNCKNPGNQDIALCGDLGTTFLLY